jgi:hypothetical protein
MEKRQPFQQMLLGKVVICLQKTETKSMFITLSVHLLMSTCLDSVAGLF